jgi:hypothetical protein
VIKVIPNLTLLLEIALQQDAAPCLICGPPWLNLGTLLKKTSIQLEIFSKTRFFFEFGRYFK